MDDIKKSELVNYDRGYAFVINLIISFYVFFGYLFSKDTQYLSILVINLLIFSLLIQLKLLIVDGNFLKKYFFMCLLLINVIFSVNQTTSLKISISLVAVINIGIMIQYVPWVLDKIRYVYLLFASIHVFFTFVGVLFKEFYLVYIIRNLPENVQSVYALFIRANSYHGITDQTGRNAFYISIGIAVLTSFIFSTKKMTWKKRILVLSAILVFFVALFLTGRRGSLLANIISMLVVIAISAYKYRINIKKYIVPFIFIAGVFVALALLLIPETRRIFIRIISLSGNDISTGRFDLYKDVLRFWWKRPIIGMGIGSFNVRYGISAHNLYLQILAELGVIGLLVFLCFIIRRYINSLRHFLFSDRNQSNNLIWIYIQTFSIIYCLVESPITELYFLLPWILSLNAFSLMVRRDII